MKFMKLIYILLELNFINEIYEINLYSIRIKFH